MIRRPPRSTQSRSSAASDVYKRQDHLKSASDLGVPVVGVGLFYKTGYFKQSLSRDGWQQETYPVLDPDDLPLALLRETDGKPCIITIDLPGGRVLRARCLLYTSDAADDLLCVDL